MSLTIYVLGGPNLNLLGTREPEIYGQATLEDIRQALEAEAGGDAIVFRQTNGEGELVEWIQEASASGDALILNAAAYTHTSIAIHDALKACRVPVVEVHLSNPAAREPFRQTNYVAPAANATIAGLGAYGYLLALQAARHLVSEKGQSAP
jgi:3-dehydroquinate dehydratase-2